MKSIELCAKFWASKLQIVDKREIFKAALAGALLALWDSKPEECQRLGVFVGVDYDPDRVILHALHVAGIPCAGTFFSAEGILPQKTRSWIYPDRVDVCNGYGAPVETLTEESGDVVTVPRDKLALARELLQRKFISEEEFAAYTKKKESEG